MIRRIAWLACAVLAWTGQASGAFEPRSARFHHFDREDGLSQVTILSMAQDRSGRLWLGTQNGANASSTDFMLRASPPNR